MKAECNTLVVGFLVLLILLILFIACNVVITEHTTGYICVGKDDKGRKKYKQMKYTVTKTVVGEGETSETKYYQGWVGTVNDTTQPSIFWSEISADKIGLK